MANKRYDQFFIPTSPSGFNRAHTINDILLLADPTAGPTLGKLAKVTQGQLLISATNLVTGTIPTGRYGSGTIPTASLIYPGVAAGKYLDDTGAFTVPPAGTGFADPMTTLGDIIIRNALNATARLAAGTEGQVLKIVGGLPVWAADISGSGGLSDPMTTVGDIIIRNGSNVTARLAIGSVGQVLTNVGGAVAWATPSSGFSDPMTTVGDVIYRNGSNVTARLPLGSAGQVLTVVSGAVAWATPSSGFADPMTTVGDVIYRNGSNVTARLPVGTNGQVLTLVSGVPAWAAASSGFADPMTTIGDLIVRNGANTTVRLGIGSAGQVLKVVSGVAAWAAESAGTGTAARGVSETGGVFSLDKAILGTDYGDQKIDFVDLHTDSTNGDDADPGAEATPKETIAGVQTAINTAASTYGTARLGLKANSTFREMLTISQNGVKVNTYNLLAGGNQELAILTGADVQTGWTLTGGTTNVYNKSIAHTLGSSNPNYDYVQVVEIDVELERVAPFSARTYLTLAASTAAADALPGSFFASGITSPLTVHVHATIGGDPDTNGRRYEATVRTAALALNGQSGLVAENLILRDAGGGYGPLGYTSGGGENVVVKGCVLQGGGTHNSVTRSGLIENCVYIPGATNLANGEIGHVFYETDGLNNYGTLRGCTMFDFASFLYAHQGGSGNNYHEAVAFDHNHLFGKVGYSASAFGCEFVKDLYLRNNYAEHTGTWFTGVPTRAYVSGNVVRGITNTSQTNSPSNLDVTVNVDDNIFVTAFPSTGPAKTLFYTAQPLNKTNWTNDLMHLKSDHASGAAFFARDYASPWTVYRSIFISEMVDGVYSNVVSIDQGGVENASPGYTADYNVYIILNGNGFTWTAINPFLGSPTLLGLAAWQANTLQDQNSIEIDLSANPLGLKAIFVDPDNGNWCLNESALADSVRAVFAGPRSQLTSYPVRPSFEQAIVTMKARTHLVPSDLWQFGKSSPTGSGSAYLFQQSINESSGVVNLLNDQTSPGNNMVYGTNGSGVKGWKADPSGASGWGLTGNTLAGTGTFGTISNHSVQLKANNTNVGAITAAGKFTWNIPLGTESADFNVQVGGNITVTGTTAHNAGFDMNNTVTALANSGPAYGLKVTPVFDDDGFTGVSHQIAYFAASVASELAFTIFNLDAGNDATLKVLGANGTVAINSAYGIFTPGVDLSLHAGGTSIWFNVGFSVPKARLTSTGLLMVNTTTDDTSGAKLQVAGGITTDPADATRSMWLFGEAVTTVGLVLSTITYVKLKIGSTLYNLATVELP